MTPERKAYLARCSSKEDFIRANISYYKQQLKSLKMPKLTIGCMLRHLRGQIKRTKWHLNAYRHELNRLKGMNNVVVPRRTQTATYFADGEWKQCNLEHCSCGALLDKVLNIYCHKCGKRILWEKVE